MEIKTPNDARLRRGDDIADALRLTGLLALNDNESIGTSKTDRVIDIA